MNVKKIYRIVLFSMACVLYLLFLYQKHCEKELKIYNESLKEKVQPLTADRKTEQNLILDSLFFEAEESAKNIWSNSINYNIDNATIDTKEKAISFNSDPFLIGKINDKTYVLLAAIYRTGGFTACEIGKIRSFEIINRFGEPRGETKTPNKYVYTKNNVEISFMFDNNSILKNIVINFN